MLNARVKTMFWCVLPIAALILFALIQTWRGVYFYEWVQDIFIPLEGVEHIRRGEMPHRDFGTPVGALYYYICYLPTLVTPLSARTIVYANLIVGLVVALVAVWLGRVRLPSWAASINALYLGMVAMSPRQIGEPFATITYNAAYNRYGWAIVGVVALILALPVTSGRRAPDRRDGIVTGLLLAMLFFIKLTYFAAGVALVLVALATTRSLRNWRFPVAVAGVVLATLGLVELTTGLVHLYMHDISAAAAVAGNPLRPVFAATLFAHAAVGGVLVLIVGLLVEWPATRSWPWMPRTSMGLATALAGVAIGVQNHPELENPLLVVAALIACSPGLGIGEPIAVDAPRHLPRNASLVCVAAFLGLAAIPFAQDAGATLWTALAPRATGAQVDWLAATPLRDLALHRPSEAEQPTTQDAKGIATDVQFTGILADGASLLRRHLNGRNDAVVFSLSWSNPYPILFGLPPVPHELAWWDEGRTFSANVKPDAKGLLTAVDYVMVPGLYYNPQTTTALRAVYAEELDREFKPVDRSEGWTLLARRDCRARSFC